MPSTYTTNNGIELIATSEQSGTWGDTTNTNLTLVDASLDGHTSITLVSAGSSGTPNDLPITDGASSNGRNRALIFTDGGDLGADVYVRLTPNDAKKIIFVRNSLSGSRNLILFQGTYNASNDFVLAAGKDAIVKFDGAGAGAVASAVLENLALDAATITTISNTTLNTATVNATTVDTTNVEVTNLKAKDGTASATIANSTGVITIASSVLTTTDINGGTVDGVTIGGASAGAGTFTTLTVDTNTLYVDATNNRVGVGTTAPGYDLDVVSSGAAQARILSASGSNAILRIENSGTADETKIYFGDNDDADIGQIIYDHSADAMRFYTSAAERLELTNTATIFNEGGSDVDFRIESDTNANAFFLDGSTGYIGIGVGSPSAPIDVVGSPGTLAEFRDGVSANFIIETAGAVTTIGNQAGSSQLAFKSANSEAMRIDSSGNLICGSDGGGDIGSSTKRFKDLYLSGGAYIGGTVSANLLDDYEEGTWTPVIADAQTGGNLGSASVANARYTKVGNLVTAGVELTNVVTTGMTAANTLYIRGLPFTSSATNQTVGSVKSDTLAFQGGRTCIYCIVDSSQAFAFFQVSGSGVTDTNVDVGDVTSGTTDITFTIAYFT